MLDYMKSIELLPTDENILDTIYKDPFNRNIEIEAFLKMLTTIEGHFSISIDGKWGSGKTFFIKQCEMVLNVLDGENSLDSEKSSKILHSSILSQNNLRESLKKQKCVYFDAWANDSYGTPLIALLNTLINNQNLLKIADLEKLKSTLKKIGEKFLSEKIGFDVSLFDQVIQRKEIQDFQEQLDLHEYIENVINSLIEDGQRLNIFIDELDRCNPRFAVKLLEEIKHYFLLDNITFIFSTNIEELSKTVNKFYGNEFSGDKYLNRFFDLSLSIPEIDQVSYFRYLTSKDSSWVYKKNELAVIKFLNMSLREVNSFVTNNEIIDYQKLASNPEIFTREHKDIYMYVLWSVVPILVGFHTVNDSLYRRIISGTGKEVFSEALRNVKFWDLLQYDALYTEVFELCGFSKSLDFEKNVENVTAFIYKRLFIEPITINQAKTEADIFWCAISQNLNGVLKTISQNFRFE